MAARKISNRDQLAEFVAKVGVILQRKANRKQRLEARIAKNSAKVDADRKTLSRANDKDDETITQLAVSIFAYAEPNQAELLPPDKSTAPVGTGTVRWYNTTGGLGFTQETAEEATIAELQALLEAGTITRADFDEVINTKLTLKKNPLKERQDILDRLKTTYVANGRAFAIQPANTAEKFARPIAVLTKAAIEAGLMPK